MHVRTTQRHTQLLPDTCFKLPSRRLIIFFFLLSFFQSLRGFEKGLPHSVYVLPPPSTATPVRTQKRTCERSFAQQPHESTNRPSLWPRAPFRHHEAQGWWVNGQRHLTFCDLVIFQSMGVTGGMVYSNCHNVTCIPLGRRMTSTWNG